MKYITIYNPSIQHAQGSSCHSQTAMIHINNGYFFPRDGFQVSGVFCFQSMMFF